MKRFQTSLFGLVLAALFSVVSPLLAQQRSITPEDIADLQSVTEARLSPMGNTIAYVVRIPGGESDGPGKRWFDLYTMPTSGGKATRLTGKPLSANTLTWSPEGDKLYFLSTRADFSSKPQVYVMPISGGEAMAVSNHPDGVNTYMLSPDGRSIAFTANDGTTPEEDANAKKGKDWVVYGENPKYTRLFVLNIATGTIKKVFTDNLMVQSFAWSPDNQTLFFTASERPEVDATYMFCKIYKVAANGGTPSVVCPTAGKLGHLEVSPNGANLAYAAAVDISDPLAQSLWVVPVAGGTPINHSLDREASVVSFQWLTDQSLAVLHARGCYSSLEELTIKSAGMGTWRPIYDHGVIFNSFHAIPNMGSWVAAAQSPSHPSEVFAGSLRRNEVTRLTFHNQAVLSAVKLTQQEVISWKSWDGTTIEGILTYPQGYVKGTTNATYPLLLQIHGGPEGISQNGFNTRALYPAQLYAANGFFVLEPNYRGSQGRGVKYSKADHNDLGGKEYEDVLSGITHLGKLGLVDTNRVGTGGFSYGGYFSAWGATKYSSKFKAAMVGAGITNWVSFTGTCDIPWENTLVHWNLKWWDNPELVWTRSPMAYIAQCNTPVLFVHGEKDTRVPLGQSEEMYNTLRMMQKPTQMVMYKRQPHGINERAAQIDYMNRTLEWYKKYVK